jgi:TctA family transporter
MSFVSLAVLLGFAGAVLGNIAGVVPGLTALTMMSIVLPISFMFHDPILALVFLAAIYCGSAYGETLSSAISKVPGEISMAVINNDVWDFAQKNQTPRILSISTISSFISSIASLLPLIGLCVLFVSSPSLFSFSPLTITILLFIAIGLQVRTHTKNKRKNAMSLCFGALLGCVGVYQGIEGVIGESTTRFMFGFHTSDFVSVPIIGIAFFGVLTSLQMLYGDKITSLPLVQATKIKYTSKIREAISLFPRRAVWPTLRGSVIGWVCGIVPGVHTMVATTISYTTEHLFRPSKINKIASVEAANNSHHTSSYVPFMLMGIPTNIMMSLILSSFLVNGATPGINFIHNHLDGVIIFLCSLAAVNVFLLISNIKLVKLWIKVLYIPKVYIYSFTLLASLIAVYIINQNFVDIIYVGAWTLIGALLCRYEFNLMGIIVGLIIGPLIEENLQRALILAGL